MFLDPLFDAMPNIALGFVRLAELAYEFIILITKLVPMAFNIFNPYNLINDIILGIILGIKVVIKGILDMISPRSFFGAKKTEYNRNNDTGSGLFGMRRPYDNKKKKLTNKTKDRVCVKPTIFRLIMMVLCPPLSIFLHMGLKGWLHTIICTVLTIYGYYFPGLIYAILHIMC